MVDATCEKTLISEYFHIPPIPGVDFFITRRILRQ